MRRRAFLPLAGIAAAAAAYSARHPRTEPKLPEGPRGKSPVVILRADSYRVELTSKLIEGIRACRFDVRGKRVLLKPNLVEFDPDTVINTDVTVVVAALEAFRSLGASEVLIGEGPGHRRDTLGLAEEAGYQKSIPRFDSVFTDLNRDDVTAVRDFFNEDRMYFPNTVLGADVIVSVAKMKTHHWAGATLSMKNLFGLVPGSVYGWPKNKLHYIGIPEAVVALNRRFRNTFSIVDGITGMEGNGPIQGTPKHAGLLVMGRDAIAVDSTCCRVMGIDPKKVEYLRLAAEFGHIEADRIDQRGESLEAVTTPFGLLQDFQYMRLVL